MRVATTSGKRPSLYRRDNPMRRSKLAVADDDDFFRRNSAFSE
jgi:hypothetical protein